ncbi:MAG: PspC domain-containing protein [Solirubrobacteraceae bacterium]|nr:PspC domain-containing protein [Solirubrobacteraceae bacterium]
MTAPDAPAFARPPRGDGRLLAGVAAGLAARWGLSPVLVRAAFVVATLAYGAGALLYAALALTMPVRGASAQRVARSAELGRTLLVALRVAGAALALLALAGLAAGLALFGLGVVALLLACACVITLVVRPGLRAAPLGAAAVALTLPAAGVALADTEIAPQAGAKTVELRTPSDVDPAGYRAGTGPLLVDLRRFAAPAGSITTVRARADLRSLVVALPRNRCFSLVVDQTLDRRWPAELLDRRRPAVLHLGAPARFPLPQERRLAKAGAPPSLVAYGRPIMGGSVRWRQTAADHDAPVLHLVLTTGRSQAIVRDYPAAAHPLDDPWWPWPHVLGAPRFGIPKGTKAMESVPDDPYVPTILGNIDRLERRPMGRQLALTDAITSAMSGVWEHVDGRRRRALQQYTRQELLLRRAAREPLAYRDRFLGRCMRPSVKRRTIVPVQIPSTNAAANMLAARWSVVWERWPTDRHLRPAAASNPKTSIDPVEIATARP